MSEPRNPRSAFIYLEGKKKVYPLHSLNFVGANPDIHRIWSCNGLLCLCIFTGGKYCYEYYICNPTTNKSIKLPDLESSLASRILSMTIAFDPYMSQCYKVVCVSIFGMQYRFSIYSSETKIWREAGNALVIANEDHYLFKRGVFWNNSVHWISKLVPFLRFDMDKECVQKMPATPIPRESEKRLIPYFGSSKGHLHLIELQRSNTALEYILEMKRDYSEWALRQSVNFSQLTRIRTAMDFCCINCIRYYFPLENEPHRFCLVISTAIGMRLVQLSHNSKHFDRVRSLCEPDKGFMTQFKWYRRHPDIMTLTAV